MRVGTRTSRDDGAPVDELDVFATGATERADSPWARPADGVGPDSSASPFPAPRPRDPLAGAYPYPIVEEQATGVRGGARPVAATSPSETGRASDAYVLRPILVDPTDAIRVAVDGGVFDERLPHLRLLAYDQGELAWTVLVVGRPWTPTPATLRLLGSRSMAVTLLELVPSERVRLGRRRFVRNGIAAIDEVARRIELAAR